MADVDRVTLVVTDLRLPDSPHRPGTFLQRFQTLASPFVEPSEPEERGLPVPSVYQRVEGEGGERVSVATEVSTAPWFVMSAISSCCCGWLLGLLALVFVCQARDANIRGRHSVARNAVMKVRLLLLIGLVLGVVVWSVVAYRVYEQTRDPDPKTSGTRNASWAPQIKTS